MIQGTTWQRLVVDIPLLDRVDSEQCLVVWQRHGLTFRSHRHKERHAEVNNLQHLQALDRLWSVELNVDQVTFDSTKPDLGQQQCPDAMLRDKPKTGSYLHINITLCSKHEVVYSLGNIIVCVGVVSISKGCEGRMQTGCWISLCQGVSHHGSHHAIRMMRVLDGRSIEVSTKNGNVSIWQANQAHLQTMNNSALLTVHACNFIFCNKIKVWQELQ